jgi:hypothetical protein
MANYAFPDCLGVVIEGAVDVFRGRSRFGFRAPETVQTLVADTLSQPMAKSCTMCGVVASLVAPAGLLHCDGDV